MLKVLYIRHRRLLIIQVYMEFSDQLFTTRNPVVSRLSDRFLCDKELIKLYHPPSDPTSHHYQ
ncbi:hypothetical protein I7I53_05300 [Histoplasma capsulatum var. duboisii H88]|uniref:Uncharacterized protein n=1 Tax=Ajellomyces capsulatus (strain H88) TaxID=544711 RepID=A0A8A1LRQ0_AJEC8|nr:hypothetical protein I7I53_05300 [Histoplasma capsulatum var. duboisii H88]